VVIVALDSQSLRAFPEWPWPRGRYGEVIRRLDEAGAAVIAFDIDFSSPQSPVEDAKLATAVTASGRVILAGMRQFQHVEHVGSIEIASFPIPRLAAGAAAMAAAIVPLDDDGFVRSAFRVPEIAGRRLPSLARASLALATNSEPRLEGEGRFPIDFRRTRPPIGILPISDVMEGRFDPGDVRGRVVFVGATAPILQDLWPTPIAPTLPGVMIQAIEYRQHVAQLTGQTLLAVPGPVPHLAIILFLSIAARLVSLGRRRWIGCLALGLAIPPVFLGVVTMTGILLEPALPILVVATHYALGTERIRRQIHGRLRDREESMSAIARVGKITADPFGRGGVKMALRLLAQATGAQSMVLLRLGEDGRFEPDPVEWARVGRARPVDLAAAERMLAAREIRVFSGRSQLRFGSVAQILYVPLVAATEPIGLLAAEYEMKEPPDPVQVSTIATMAGQIALATANDRLIEDLRGAKDEAEAANRAKTEFLANMSHEIRTPMTAILGYIDLLADPETPDDHQTELLEIIQRNGEHLLNLISDILDLSQIEAERMSLNLRVTNPIDICRDIETLLRPKADEKGLRFEVEIAEEVPEAVQTDPLRLGQILMNVIGNAIKFTEAGSVTVKVTMEDPRKKRERLLRFEVIDTGVGMDPETQARAFDRFIQADMSATREFGGTGLGLAIAKRLVEIFGGAISCESQVGHGSRFTFTIETGIPQGTTLPAAAGEGATVSKPAPTLTPTGELPALAGRALLAEDGPDNQRILSLFLSKAGVEVEVVENGQLACERVLASFESGEPYDLIFMDIDMPVMDGYEATTLIRDAGFSGPIIALTAHALPGDREKCLNAGCDDYLTKPPPREKLVAMAASYLGETKKVEP
jgi:signal transduction histidine kinase/CHASE2 domain-containing sensor protein